MAEWADIIAELPGRVQGLIEQANATTGNADADLTAAVGSLIAGFSQGEGGDTAAEDGLITKTMTEYANDRVTQVGVCGLAYMPNLTTLSIPNVTYMDNYGISSNPALTNVYAPKLTRFGTWGVQNCTALTSITLPSLERVGTYGFEGCAKLQFADLGNVDSITARCFSKTVLDTLVLRKNGLVALSNSNAFGGTPFEIGGTGGTVYVPTALIEDYQTATNWSTLYEAGTCNFVAIEGSAYE